MLFSEKIGFCFIDYETTGVHSVDNDGVYPVPGIDFKKHFPIQIGYILTRNNLTLHYGVRENILHPNLFDILESCTEWPSDYSGAYKVHNIKLFQLFKDLNTKFHYYNFLKQFFHDCYNFKQVYNLDKLILISDNIQFEFSITCSLYHDYVNYCKTPKITDMVDWPFHYCGWDTSILFELFDVDESNKSHDAYDDAKGILENLSKLVSKINKKMLFKEI